MTPLFRKLHKWIGLIVGIQLILWLLSGLVMSLLDSKKVAGDEFRREAAAVPQWPRDALSPEQVVQLSVATPTLLRTAWLGQRPVYHLGTEDGVSLLDARTADRVKIDPETVSGLAAQYYSGAAKPGVPRLLDWSDEVREFKEPVWRVDFADEAKTTAYISASTGELVELRNTSWRLFDFVWMFHIMDYANRANFNNPLLVSTGLAGLFLSLFGFWLLFTSFKIADFSPRAWRKKRNVRLVDTAGLTLRELQLAGGDDLLSALRQEGIGLPSNCGGGQSCGLCVVRVREDALPSTSSDRAMLSADQVRRGYRLACNLRIHADLCVEVSTSSSAWETRNARIRDVIEIGPNLREFILDPETVLGPEFAAGSFVQVHVPEFVIDGNAVNLTNPDGDVAERIEKPGRIVNKSPVRRSYSLSSEPEREDGSLRLLVRYVSAQRAGRARPPGKGSAYLFSRRRGDRIDFTGPFGDFRLRDTDRPKIFIGSGAGIGPLRAMAMAQSRKHVQTPYVLQGFRRSGEAVPYEREFRELAQRDAQFRFVASEPDRTADSIHFSRAVGELLSSLRSRSTVWNDSEFYLCGGPGFIREVRTALREASIPADRISLDDFLV